jgi:hypothetical protein
MTSSQLSQSLHALFKNRSINASEMNLVVDNAICPSREFVDEVLHVFDDDSSSCCSLGDSFASIFCSSNSPLDEQDDKSISLDSGDDRYGDCRWETSLDNSFANIRYTNSSLDEQEDEIISLGGDEDSDGDRCRWETNAKDNKNTALVPPCRCSPPPSKTTPMTPKRRLPNSKGEIPRWMMLQMMPTDGSGNTSFEMNVADILKETEELLTLDSPAASTNPVVLYIVRNYEIVSKSV